MPDVGLQFHDTEIFSSDSELGDVVEVELDKPYPPIARDPNFCLERNV